MQQSDSPAACVIRDRARPAEAAVEVSAQKPTARENRNAIRVLRLHIIKIESLRFNAPDLLQNNTNSNVGCKSINSSRSFGSPAENTLQLAADDVYKNSYPTLLPWSGSWSLHYSVPWGESLPHFTSLIFTVFVKRGCAHTHTQHTCDGNRRPRLQNTLICTHIYVFFVLHHINSHKHITHEPSPVRSPICAIGHVCAGPARVCVCTRIRYACTRSSI